MITKNNNRFYVYALLDPRKPGRYEYGDICFLYEPFYIGKGTGRRTSRHLSRDRLKSNTPKNQKIKKLLSSNLKPIEQIFISNLNSDDALKIEIDMIKFIGRKDTGKGILTNTADGGEGASCGHIVKNSTRKKISNSLKGKNVGRKLTKSWKQKIKDNNSKYWEGKNHSQKTINKIKKWRKNQDMSYRIKSYKVISPNDEIFIVDYGLQKFCDKHNLTRSHLINVAKNRRNHHKGWKCEYYFPN